MDNQTTIQLALPHTHTVLLHRIAHALTLTDDTSTFLKKSLDELSALLEPVFVQVLLLNRENDTLVLAAAAGPLKPLQTTLPRILPQVEAALLLNRATLIENPIEAALAAQFDPLATTEFGALAFMPLVAQGKPLGALVLGIPQGRSLAAEDVILVELIGGSLSGAVYIGRLADAMHRRNEQLTMVADIAAQVSSSLETREVYRLVVQKLNEYFKVAAGSLMLRDEDTEELVFVMTLEGGAEKLHGVRIPPDTGIAGHVAQTQQIYIANDAQHDPRHYRRIDERVGFVTERLLCVPMVVKGNTIGVIELLNKLDGPFSEEEAQRLSAVANIIGVAIENARLFEFVRQRRARLESLLDLTIRGLPQEKLVAVLSRELETQDSLLSSKFKNPYIVGAPVLRPEMCFGREILFKRILSVLHQNSLLLHGERRIGKTTVLRQLELRLNLADDPEYRFRPVYVDLQGIEETAFFHHMMEEVLHYFGKRAKGLELRYHPKRTSYSGREFQRDLRTLITMLCGPQPNGRIDRLVLLMDEADGMYLYNERLLQEFRRIFMNDYAVYLSVVFAAVDIHRQWKRYESPLYNLFQQIQIPPLSRADTELLIRTPVRALYEYDDAAVELIFTISGGRPMKVQHLCLEAIDHIREQGRTRVTAEDIERISEAIKGQELWL